MGESRLLKSAYLSELAQDQQGKPSWYTFIKTIMGKVRCSTYLNETQSDVMGKRGFLKSRVTKYFQDLYFVDQFNDIDESSKLRTYVSFKQNFKMEQYLQIKNIPLYLRKNYCAFRISAHDLEIERGRYSRPRKPPEHRLCPICKNCSEDELHFLMHCPAYTELRQKFSFSIIRLDKSFIKLSSFERMRYLMTNQDPVIVQSTMRYLTDIFN